MYPGIAFELWHLVDLDWIQITGAQPTPAVLVRLLRGLQPAAGDLLAMSWTRTQTETSLSVLVPQRVSGKLRARLRSRSQSMGACMQARRDLRAVVVEHRDPTLPVGEGCARVLADADIEIHGAWLQGALHWFLLPRESSKAAFVYLYQELMHLA